MKILMMFLMAGLVGCNVDTPDDVENITIKADTVEVVEAPEVVEVVEDVVAPEPAVTIELPDDAPTTCADLSTHRVGGSGAGTSYTFLTNECNTLTSASFRTNGTMSHVKKTVSERHGIELEVQIVYNNIGFVFFDTSGGTGNIKYSYINGDNFLTIDYPGAHVDYLAEGEKGYEEIIEAALYENVIEEVRVATGKPEL